MSLILALMTAICVGTASAEIHYVTYGESIQQAVNNSANGDTVLIAEGVYTETTVLYGRALTIGSQFLMDGDTSHIAMTAIYADTLTRPDTASCFVYAYGESPSSRLVGLTLAGGRGTAHLNADRLSGGGIHVKAVESEPMGVMVDHCQIEDCRAELGGGIFVMAFGGQPVVALSDCDIEECVAEDGGGGIFTSGGTVTAIHCLFRLDSALGIHLYGLGAAIFGYGYTALTLDSCEVNACAGMDAAVDITNHCTALISNSRFMNNASYYGDAAGAIDLAVWLPPLPSRAVISRRTLPDWHPCFSVESPDTGSLET